MFTGLIETMGRVEALNKSGGVYELELKAGIKNFAEFIGQSISVSGACLTVTEILNEFNFRVQLMPESFNRTWFKDSLRPGVRLNLERAMKLGGRLDGHLVLGHVDGVAVLRSLDNNKIAVFEPEDRNLLRGIVNKGSVAVDGVSLTVIDAGDKTFSLGLIPETLKNCTLGEIKAGSRVNIETDILGKFVERLLNFKDFKNNKNNFNLSLERLSELGYV
ncbi:MAG: riboflavin synthase [Synergistaceae bacterium]|nr:riboflavin synthase [Synergistaceae bacterium]